MAKKIIWTPQAEKTFTLVLEYLQRDWTTKEIKKFISATDKTIGYISKNPEMFRKSIKADIHEALITKHNLVLYKIKKETIDLLVFWDTRRNPKKKK